MNDLINLLSDNKIKNALIIDDSFNIKPNVSNISYTLDDWDRFFDDLQNDDINLIRAHVKDYDDTDAEDLKTSDSFIETLWDLRDEIPASKTLFARYSSDMSHDLELLNKLKNTLNKFNIHSEELGIVDAYNDPKLYESKILSNDVDIIFIDLFLGGEQDTSAQERSSNLIKRIISKRKNSPPLVILMSRSTLLQEKRIEFRDNIGIIESMFRILSKKELSDESRVTQVLFNLVSAKENSYKILNFINAWSDGISNAMDKTLDIMRSFDLSTYSKLKELLLDGEGESTGSYIVDIFELIMQHKLEENNGIIDAAIDLNNIADSKSYYPYITTDKYLHELLYSVMFKNNNRIRISPENYDRLAFGDMFIINIEDSTDPHYFIEKYESDNIFIVITPACDLQREIKNNVILLKGNIRELSLNTWVCNDNELITPIVKIEDCYKSIKWDAKSIETLSAKDIAFLLSSKKIKKVARLRENATLSLQQVCLSSIGRIGLIAPMPASYAIELGAYYMDSNKELKGVHLKNDESPNDDYGVCYVGRHNGRKNIKKISLSEDLASNLRRAISNILINDVHPKNQGIISKISESIQLQELICHSLELENLKNKPYPLHLDIDGDNKKVGYIIEDPSIEAMTNLSKKQDAALVFVIKECCTDV
ncbi:hypothetical protein [Klebsiella pneumoniae]|uniref:hypothetical protein n=1 Tax=Klebsiella pneumoniae TaxID=573 RepID=UPI001037FF6F|nr:hypothetical protein [Klebsiella pneumoniae]EIY4902206.1 hypothetical protein [Klebsiella quasipneumoniae]QBI34697.1 hypothetical protein WN11_13060 [Klebsiella pneumoniae]